MTSKRRNRVESLFDQALAQPPDEREAWLRAHCDDAELRRDVGCLLAAHKREDGILDLPIHDFAAKLVTIPEDKDAVVAEDVGPYRLLKKIGRGGMGVVYKARHFKLGRNAALKFLPPSLASNDEARERFLQEARAAARLDHSNLCTIYDIGETERGRLYIAMAYYEGETLKERIARGPLPVEDAVEWTLQIAEGLQEAHAAGILHRDVKPANVMVTHDGEVKILDFGLAKMADVSLTKTGTRQGTVAYMSPEQAQGAAMNEQTDVWSLGVVLYEMLTGDRPFRGGHEQAIIYAIRHEEPEPVEAVRTGIPDSLAQIVKRTLDKCPAERYATTQDLARDLKAVRTDSCAAVPSSARTNVRSARPGQLLANGERRQATIFVSRLAGYTDLMEQYAPGKVERIMRRINDEAVDIMRQRSGVVNQFSGDAIVSVFGILATHEDDFLRATRAAVELHARVRELGANSEEHPVRLRSGIDTGLVVARKLDQGRQTYRIAGRARRVAARLAAEAETDEILVSTEGHRLVDPFFETEVRAPVAVKGHSRPITPYRIVSESEPQSPIEVAEQKGLTAYTGRENELGTLARCLEQALQGEGQLVTVEGKAGLGKSRLLYEFRQGLDRKALQLLQGRCQTYGGNIPYLPFIGALKDLLHLRESDPNTSPVERVVSRVRAIDPELEDFIPFYLHLLSIPNEDYPLPKHLEGEHFRLAMIEALSAIVTLSAKRTPIVMLLEDWHWADTASQEVLQQVAEMVSSYSLLLVVTYRPERPLDWGQPARHTPIHLSPLDASSSITVMMSVAGTEGFPKPLGRLVYERTGGNPFFLEEICRTLLEEGTLKIESGQAVLKGSLDTLQLPTTVQAVIRTRMDRMDPAARYVLCVASVIGREFTRGLLQRTLPEDTELLEPLNTLRALGLIHQTRVLPTATYRFKHVLTQEVAYESLLLHQRKTLHGHVGRALEALQADRLDEHLDLLAHHFSQAEDWQKAICYGRRAAQKANDLSQFPEALQMLEKTEQWLSEHPEEPNRHDTLVNILLQQERLCETMGLRGRQQEIIDALLARMECDSDQAKCAEVYLRQGDLYTLLREFDAAEDALRRALVISRDLSDAIMERNVLRSLGLLRWHEGQNEDALDYIKAALSIDREWTDDEAMLGDLANLGNVLKGMGAYEQAQTYLEEALALSEHPSTDDLGGELLVKRAHILHNLGTVHRALDNIDRAIDYFQQAVEQGAQHRLPIQQSYHLTSLAHVYLQQGMVDKSLRLYNQAVDLGRRTKNAVGLSQSLRIFGTVLHGLGRHDKALSYLQEAAGLFAQLEDQKAEALMWSKIAEAYEQREDDSDALAAWRKARALHRQETDPAGTLKALQGLARVTRRHVKEPSLALGYYREALELAQELDDRATEGRLRNTMGILQWRQEAYEEALAHYQNALDLFREVEDPVHEGLMLNSLGVTLRKLGRVDEAIARLDEAIERNHQAEQRLLEGHGLAALAGIYLDQGKTERAWTLYKRSLDIRRDIEDRRGEAWMLYHLARVHAARGTVTRVRTYVRQAAKIANECSDEELIEACRQLWSR